MIRVRIVIEVDVEPEAWVAAATEEEWLEVGDEANDPTDLIAVAHAATAYIDAEDYIPRWSRDAVTYISQTLEIVQ